MRPGVAVCPLFLLSKCFSEHTLYGIVFYVTAQLAVLFSIDVAPCQLVNKCHACESRYLSTTFLAISNAEDLTLWTARILLNNNSLCLALWSRIYPTLKSNHWNSSEPFD